MFSKLKLQFCYRFCKVRVAQFTLRLSRNIKRRILYSPQYLLLAFSPGAAFSFQSYGVSDEELSDKQTTSDLSEKSDSSEGWEQIYEAKDIKVSRRKLKGQEIYEYRCAGSYNDITPISFIDAQLDIEYRSKWDENILEVEVLEEDTVTDSQVVKWVTKFPYPLYPRMYIFVRRKIVDTFNKQIVVVCKALDSKVYPDGKKNVRVTNYKSKLIVRAHTKLDEKGFDYLLFYYDDPKCSIPSIAYNYIVHRSGPYFLEKVYKAAQNLPQEIKSEVSIECKTSDVREDIGQKTIGEQDQTTQNVNETEKPAIGEHTESNVSTDAREENTTIDKDNIQ